MSWLDHNAEGAVAEQGLGSARPSSTRYFALGWLCLAATIAYICRNSIGVAESTIREDLHLTDKQMGLVMGIFFLSYAAGQIPAGWLGHRWGSRRCIPLFAIGWSTATALMSGAAGLFLLVASRFLNGVFQAGLFPCCTNTIAKWFPDNRRAVASGSLGSFMSLGGAIGSFVTGILVVSIGWRMTFVSFSLLGVVWAIGFWLWFRDRPEDHASVNAEELAVIRTSGLRKSDLSTEGKPQSAGESTDLDEAVPWLAIYSSPATWWICAQQFCRAAGQIFFSSWFATYLQETRSVSVKTSGFLNSLPLVALVAGGLSGGAVSDWLLTRTGSRRIARQGLAVVCMFACAGLVAVAYAIEDPLLAVGVISVGTFCAAVGGPCAYTITIDMGGRHVATLFATMNMIGNFGALAFIYGVPWFREQMGSWDSVLGLFVVIYVAAGLFWWLLNPRGDIFDQSLLRSTSRT